MTLSTNTDTSEKTLYRVDEIESFYEEMIGELVFKTDKTIMLEFKMEDALGGTHRVMFFNHQVEKLPAN